MYIFTTYPSPLVSSFMTFLGLEARGRAGCAWVTIFMGHFNFVCGVKTEPLCIDGGSGPVGCVPFLWALGTLRIMGYFFPGLLFIAFSVRIYECVTCLKLLFL